MNKIKHHINIALVCLNTVGLTAYCQYQSSVTSPLTFLPPFFLGLVALPAKTSLLRSLYCSVSVLALISIFLPFPFVSGMAGSLALGISLALGYQLTNQIQPYHSEMTVRLYEASLNISIALGVILSTVGVWIGFTLISAKLFVLMTTLGNFYLSTSSQLQKIQVPDRIKSKVCCSLVPFYMQAWTYGIGYSIGIYLNTFELLSPKKHGKYMVVSLLILIEMLTYKNEIKMICELLRAVLIYHFERNTKPIQIFFVFFFLMLRVYFDQNGLNLFLLLGYGGIAISLWRSQYRDSGYSDTREPMEPEIESEDKNQIEMQFIDNQTPESPQRENRQNSKASSRKTSRLLK